MWFLRLFGGILVFDWKAQQTILLYYINERLRIKKSSTLASCSTKTIFEWYNYIQMDGSIRWFCPQHSRIYVTHLRVNPMNWLFMLSRSFSIYSTVAIVSTNANSNAKQCYVICMKCIGSIVFYFLRFQCQPDVFKIIFLPNVWVLFLSIVHADNVNLHLLEKFCITQLLLS